MNQRRHIRIELVWLLLSVFAVGAAWLYMNRVLGPWEHYIDVETGRLKAAMGDLYPRWVGTRAILLDGKNPYGPEVSHEIQTAFYGHPIVQSYDQPQPNIIDEQRFAYPVYVVFMLAPTVHVPFDILQTWTPVVLAVLLAISIPLWMHVLRWRTSSITAAALILFILASPQIAQGLRLRQLGFLVGSLLALAAWCIARNHLAAAGAVLALSTIKPQMALLPLAWFLVWGLGDLPRRWRLLVGFAGSMAALVGAGELILPGWHRDFLSGLYAYRKYVHFPSLLQVALGYRIGDAAGLVLVAGLLTLAWRNRKHAGDFPEFARTLSAFLIGTTLALPLLPPFNQVLLIFPALMLVRDWPALPKFSRFAFVIFLSWPWIAEIVLLAVPPQVKSQSRLPLLPSILVLLLPFLLPILLMTKRLPSAAKQFSTR
jgi:hypothetical protein